MSGQQIGGAVGFVVGMYFGYPQLGYAIGSYIGGAVDPTKVYGPRLTDASVQTSTVGVFCPFGYGTWPCSGNIIWQGPISEREHKDDGKGSGTEQVTYTYHRSYAIRICAGPITGILQIKRAGKVVYDARTDTDLLAELEAGGLSASEALIRKATIKAQNSKFISRCKIYLGDETQLPDPIIEAVEGVGNVSPFRGRAYMVVEDDDLTQSAKAIPPYEFVVSVDATVAYAAPVIGTQTHQIELDAERPSEPYASAFSFIAANGGAGVWASYSNPGQPLSGDAAYFAGVLDDSLSGGFVSTQNQGDSPGDTRTKVYATSPEGWAISGDGSFGMCELLQGGSFVADLRPTAADAASWWYDEGAWYPEFGGLIFFHSTHVYIGVRRTNNLSRNRIYRWPLTNASGAVVEATATSPVVTAGTRFYFHVDNGGIPWAIAFDEAELVNYDENLVEVSRTALPMSIAGLRAFGVDSGDLFLWIGGYIYVYSMQTWELVNTITLDTGLHGVNHKLVFTDSSLYAQSSSIIKRIAYSPSCIQSIPPGWVENPDAPGTVVSPLGEVKLLCDAVVDSLATGLVPLSTIVADLCQRGGLTPAEYDVSQLTDLVPGFRVANEGDPASAIMALAQAYFFDVGEWDGKVRFVKRGGAPVMSLFVDDLAEREGDAIQKVRMQEAELLRKVTVQYLDPGIGYNATTQAWERRTSTVLAKGEQSVEVPVVIVADTAASVSKKKGLVGWSETERFLMSLPYRFTALTPTDVIHQTDLDGNVHRIRLEQIDDDSGVRIVEARLDGGDVYSATAVGSVPPPRTIPATSIIGPTTLHVMDLPVWDKDASDELGVYVAARGILGGWSGAAVQFSTDAGATWTTAVTVTVPSNIGFTATALPAWDSAEYPSVQSVQVYLPGAPATVTYAALLANRNRAALRNDSGAWEVLQYQTVVNDGGGYYTLSGLVRGRYATTPGLASSGAAFVLLDETVQFVRAERAYLNQPLTVRGVSLGTVPENNATSSLTITGQSQTEWPPHMVEAVRDGADNVTVTWIGRARLGNDVAPYHSRYFTGYRVTYSDGQTFDVGPTTTTHTRSAAPATQTITVSALNSITGAGPASEAVTA